MEVLELLEYVNSGLSKGKSVTAIAKELGLNESAIRKRLNRNGYKRNGNQFVLKENITSNITGDIKAKEIKNNNDNDISNSGTKLRREKVKMNTNGTKRMLKEIKAREHKELKDLERRLENNKPNNNITSNITPVKVIKEEVAPVPNIDMDKLNLLLSNLDNLLKLIPSNITSNIEGGTRFRSGINDVKTFRIDSGLYEEVKKRAAQNNINIADILNKAIEDYLNNYL